MSFQGLHITLRRPIRTLVKARRRLSEAERRDHQQTLELLGKIVVAIPTGVSLQREFVLLSA